MWTPIIAVACEYYLVAMLDFKTVLPDFKVGAIYPGSEMVRLLAQYMLWRVYQRFGLHSGGARHLIDLIAFAPTSICLHWWYLNVLGLTQVGERELSWL
jgi:hypothetical protein